MKLSEVIAVWKLLHGRDIGELGFCDLEKAIDGTVGVENDVTPWQPQAMESGPKEQVTKGHRQKSKTAEPWRKVIVQITGRELRELCGFPPDKGTPSLSVNVTPTVVQISKESPGDVLVKFYGPLLPPECETLEAEVITRLSLRKMRAMMAEHNSNKGVDDE